MSDEMHHISLSQERNEHPQQQLGQKEGQLSDPLDDGDLTISVRTHLSTTQPRQEPSPIALLSNIAILTQPCRSTGALDYPRHALATGSISAGKPGAWRPRPARHAFFLRACDPYG
jgi:hypothetical protein